MSLPPRLQSNPILNEFIQKVFQSIDLSRAAIEPLLSLCHRRAYVRKAPLLSAGEQWDRLFYIHEGLIRLFYLDQEGREFNKAFFAEGQSIWPVAPHDREQGVLFHIAAVEPTTVLICPFSELHTLLCREGVWDSFALPYAERLIEQKFQREHDFLLLSAGERLEKFTAAYPDIVGRLPDYHLASFLGVTNVTLSRIRRAAIG